MWKYVQSWFTAVFCCCLNVGSTDTESPPPYIVKTTLSNDGAREINNKPTDKKTRFIAVEKVASVESIKVTVFGELPKQKIKCVTAGLLKQSKNSYVDKVKLFEEINSSDISQSFITRSQVRFPSFHQTIETHQGRRYDWGVINSWSRHMAESPDVKGTAPLLLRANVNLDKIDIPIIKSARLQKFKKTRARTSATDNQMSALADTRDRAVRPKAAVSSRTKHCFTNN